MALSGKSLGNVLLGPPDTLLKNCPFGHILECWGIASAVPLMIVKIKVNLDFHIFDILDLDLLLGSPIEKLLNTSHGRLDEKLREVASATATMHSASSMAKFVPKHNPFGEMIHLLMRTSPPMIHPRHRHHHYLHRIHPIFLLLVLLLVLVLYN